MTQEQLKEFAFFASALHFRLVVAAGVDARLDALRYWIEGAAKCDPCPHCGELLPAMPEFGRGEAGP